MITADGWLDWAVHIPSGYDKLWPDHNSLQGYIPHSAVGTAAQVIKQQADNTVPKTVHGVIAYDGVVTQFLPITASPWASGSYKANTRFVAFENEGGYDPTNEPLTNAQIDANVRIIDDLGAYKHVSSSYWHRPLDSNDVRATLYEHNECKRFGSSATACPSNRIPWKTILGKIIPMKDGWIKEAPFWVFYNDGVPTERKGATDGINKGRISYNFGGVWWWVRHFGPETNADGTLVFHEITTLSLEEGD